MFDALVVSVVADGDKPVMSLAAGCAHDGAKPAVPLPVWLRNFLVTVVFAETLSNVVVVLAYSISPWA